MVAPTSVNGEQVDAHRARRRPLADDQIELEVFHRRVEHFLDRGLQAMDLVDEQDIPGLEVCQDCGEVACPLDHRPRCGAEADPEFAGDDLRQRGLAEAGRAVQQHVVQRLAAGAGGLDEHREVLARGLLADEFGEGLGPKTGLRRILLAADGGDFPFSPSPAGGGRGEGRWHSLPPRSSGRPLRQLLQAVTDHRIERRRIAQPLDRAGDHRLRLLAGGSRG